MNVPVFDLHCDTANELIGLGGVPCSPLRKNNVHIDLERAATLDAYAQCFACYTTPLSKRPVPPVEMFERQMVSILREVEKNKDNDFYEKVEKLLIFYIFSPREYA